MRIRACISLLAATVVLAACAGDRSANGTGGGTVIVSMGADAATLFPVVVTDETSAFITTQIFDHLADIGDDMATIGDFGFTPRLAKSWDWSKDSTSISYHIDPAARFHDGVPVRSNDVRYSFRLINEPALASPLAPLVTNVDSVSTPDSLTATFWFKKHLPEEFYDVAYQIFIVPEHVYGKVKPAEMNTSEVLRHPIGSGRFRLANWVPSERIELISDTANYHGRAKLDRVVVLVAQAPDASATAVLTGAADFYQAFPFDEATRLDSNKTVRGLPYTQMGYGFLGLRVRARKSKTTPHPVLGELAVRRAISMSLDRAGMLTNVFGTVGIPAHGPVPAHAFTEDTTIRLPAYDTSAAKALLDSAGWHVGPNGIRQKNGRPLKFEVMIPASSSVRSRYGDLIREQLRRVGIQADLGKVPFSTFVPRQSSGDFDALMMVQQTDPSVSGTKQYWSSEGEKAGTNYLGYFNPKVDALLDSAGHSGDPTAVKQLASRAYRAIVDDAPAVWLYDAATLAAINRRIDLKPFRGDGWWAHLADWSIPPDKRIDRDRIGLTSKKP
jgi:peptide/nickel transport system substrate-binding protein